MINIASTTKIIRTILLIMLLQMIIITIIINSSLIIMIIGMIMITKITRIILIVMKIRIAMITITIRLNLIGKIIGIIIAIMITVTLIIMIIGIISKIVLLLLLIKITLTVMIIMIQGQANSERETWYGSIHLLVKTLATKIGRYFLNLIDKRFPRDQKFSKSFNRNNIKVCCSCIPNIKSANNPHNRKILHPHVNNQSRTCKCINKTDYPLKEKCLSEGALYQAGISSESFWVTIYHGISETKFKTRY